MLKSGDCFRYRLPKTLIHGIHAGQEVAGKVLRVGKTGYKVCLYVGTNKIIRYIPKEKLRCQ